MDSLRESAVKGIKWTAVSATFATVTAFLFQLVKARFLTPEDFAYLSILMIVIGLSRNLEAAGFNRGVIQKDQISVNESSTLLLFNIFFSILASTIVFFIGTPVAAFFDLPGLDYHLKLISLAVFFQGVSHFFIAFLEKYFYFRHIAVIQVSRQLLFVSLATGLIIAGWGVLGFVLGHVAATIISSLLYTGIGLANKIAAIKLYFSISALRPFIKFGVFVTGRQTLNILTKQIDEMIILHFLGAEIMGTYFFGKNMLERLRQLMNMSFYRLILPLLSRLKHDQDRLSEVYYKMNRYLSLVAFPVFVGISLTAHLFVPLIFGEQWMDSIIVFQVFAITLILKMFSGIMASNLLYSVNMPGTVFIIDLATDMVYITALMLFAPWGINTVIILYTGYQLIKFLAMQLAAHRRLSYGLHHYFANLKSPAVLSALMVAAVTGFQHAAGDRLEKPALLITSAAIGAVVYLVLAWLFDQKSITELKDMAFRK